MHDNVYTDKWIFKYWAFLTFWAAGYNFLFNHFLVKKTHYFLINHKKRVILQLNFWNAIIWDFRGKEERPFFRFCSELMFTLSLLIFIAYFSVETSPWKTIKNCITCRGLSSFQIICLSFEVQDSKHRFLGVAPSLETCTYNISIHCYCYCFVCIKVT